MARAPRRAADHGKRIVLWGGGSKGVAFLTTLGLRGESRQWLMWTSVQRGRYFMPSTGHAVIAALSAETLCPIWSSSWTPIS